ncbi:hypothetical protein CHUAL_007065 [Chamberlinius hualienensis]
MIAAMAIDLTNLYVNVGVGTGLSLYMIIANKFIFRLYIVTVICHVSHEMSKAPSEIVANLLSQPLDTNSFSTQFQFQLLKSSLASIQPTLNASQYVTVNKQLYLEIVSIVVTYTILMAQIETGVA